MCRYGAAFQVRDRSIDIVWVWLTLSLGEAGVWVASPEHGHDPIPARVLWQVRNMIATFATKPQPTAT